MANRAGRPRSMPEELQEVVVKYIFPKDITEEQKRKWSQAVWESFQALQPTDGRSPNIGRSGAKFPIDSR